MIYRFTNALTDYYTLYKEFARIQNGSFAYAVPFLHPMERNVSSHREAFAWTKTVFFTPSVLNGFCF